MISSIKVNGSIMNLTTFGATVKGKKLELCEFNPVTIKPVAGLTSRYVKTYSENHTLTIDIILTNSNIETLKKNVFKLTNQLLNCDICFLSEPNLTYKCILKNAKHMFFNNQKALLTVIFDTQIYSTETAVTISTKPQTITIDGARETYISFDITAKTAIISTDNFNVNGIVVKSLAVGQTVTIDSDNKIADFSKVDLYEFPFAVGSYVVTVSDLTKATVKLRYKARW